MSNIHRPKVYRSKTGCCICKAKSSSSRFTESTKYESDFTKCFQLKDPRTGEICNACVLLVKRWKKLPAGIDRHWGHVIDSRAGPGIKSLTRFRSQKKKKLKENCEKIEKIVKKKRTPIKSDGECDNVKAECLGEYNDAVKTEKRLAGAECNEDKDQLSVNGFIDLTYFKRQKVCCGVIFKGPYGEVIIDPALIKRCASCLRRQVQQQQVESNPSSDSPCHTSASTSPAHSPASSSPAHRYCSSDSGYDESSNQGVGENKIVKNNAHDSSKTIPSNIIKTHAIKKMQLGTSSLTETVRLETEIPIKLVSMNQVEAFTSRNPLPSLVTPTSLSSTAAHQIIVPNNPLIDFAMHAVARQSVIN